MEWHDVAVAAVSFFFGMLVMALCVISRDADDRAMRMLDDGEEGWG